MRRFILAAVIAVVVAAAAAGVLALRGLEGRLSADISALEQSLAAKAQLTVKGGESQLRLSPRPSVAFAGASLRTSAAKGGTPVAEGGRVVVVPRLAALAFGRREIERVVLEDMRFVARPEPTESAVLLLSLLVDAKVPVLLRNCTLAIDRGRSLPIFEISDLDLDFAARDGAIEYSGTLAALGAGSRGEVSGSWRPKSGRTGGDRLGIKLRVREGNPEALFALLPSLRTEPFGGPITFEMSAEGFLGERSTETRPAEPLVGNMRAELDFNLLGRTEKTVFENGFALDDYRLALREGKGSWGAYPFTYAGWIARGVAGNKANLRMATADVDVAELLAEYGIDERWRPQTTVSADLRMGGTLDDELTRYEAKAESARFDGWPSVPISSGPVKVGGSLLAINAEVSGSFTFKDLRIAHLLFPEQLLGVRWWRDELSITSLGQKLWDGKIDAAVAYKPRESSDVTGGGVFYDVDAESIVRAILPEFGIEVKGRIDAATQGLYDARGLSYEGRVGLHFGSLGPKGWVRHAVDQAVAAAGRSDAVTPEIAATYPVLAAAEPVVLDRAEAIFRSRENGISFAIVDARSQGATLTIDSTIDADRKLTGNAVVVLAPDLVSALVARVPALLRMVDPGGSLVVPVHLEGTPSEVEVSLDRAFAAALKRAREGQVVEPLAAAAVAPSFSIETPPLEEQFGR